MKKTYYIPTIEIICVNTVLMQSGMMPISRKEDYGHAPKPRRDPAF